MLFDQLKAILPSVLGHLVFTAILVAGLWWLFRQKISHKLSLPQALIIAVALSIYHSSGLVVNLFQARALMQVANQSGSTEARLPSDPTELKEFFLRTIESIVANPVSVPEASRASIFKDFAVLFPNGQADIKTFGQSILSAYECQKLLFDDALASHSQKKPVKSTARDNCEKASGAFFNRERLIPAEVAANNAKLIDEIVEYAKSGKPSAQIGDINSLKAEADRQNRRIQVLKEFFGI